jgi:hypothetical protein
MKLVKEIIELKKGDTIILKDYTYFEDRGFSRVFGDIFNIEKESTDFIIKCKETNSFEKVQFEKGKIFLVN